MNVITASGLEHWYETADKVRTHVLRGIDLTVSSGEFVAIMGPSGSGKTTFLYALSGMDPVSAGRITFLADDLGELSERELAQLRLHKMGFVFQQSRLLRHLNIFDNIVLPGYAAKLEPRPRIDARARDLLAQMQISDVAPKWATQASGGQLQRATICRALINQPAMILADEPTGALDSVSATRIMDIFEALHRTGDTILMVTHDAKVAARASRTLYLIDGRVRAQWTFKPEDKDAEARESALNAWLQEQRQAA